MKKLLTLFAILLITLSSISQIKVEKLDRIKKGTSTFIMEFPNYEDILDSTRLDAGSSILKRSHDLDLIAKERCLRMAKILINSKDLSADFHKEAHVDNKTPENTTLKPCGGVHKSKIEKLGPEDVLEVIANSFFTNSAEEINKRYNNSHNHLENRVSETYKTYGTCSVMVFLVTLNPYYNEAIKKNPNAMVYKYVSRRVLISYECFS